MNDTAPAASTPGASLIPDTTAAFTTMHLVVLAIFAIAVIVAIVWGARLKRARKSALRQIEEHNAELTNAAATNDRHRTLEATATPAPAVTPAPDALAHPLAPQEALDAAPVTPEPLDDEPIPAAAPLDASPASEAASATRFDGATATAPADAPVTQLKGLGPKLAQRLNELGIVTVGQIAALSDDQAAALDAQLGAFSGRIIRDRWIEQARFLAAGDRAGFEAVFGKL